MKLLTMIPSKGKSENAELLATLFPFATLYVHESEADDYSWPGRKLTHQITTGMGDLRNSMIDIAKSDGADALFMADDDIDCVWVNVGEKGKAIQDPDDILRIILNGAVIAQDIGAHLWGYSQAWDVRKFAPHDPLCFRTWASSAFGVMTDTPHRFESRLGRVDIDFSLKMLSTDRVMFCDHRFAFRCRRLDNAGGVSSIRDAEDDEREIAALLADWPGALKVQRTKTTTRIISKVPRRDSLPIKRRPNGSR